ncbi:hypothetical protein [Nannocystis punicea]|uniref:Uncharacterized protein n=1 Tax=Nannocystis punicea TaxID=2995304 RepID=A0ABY7H9W0_9BACT|nr:hypothetical protein [Nannocystis poenicansa]WAS96037.1 hypothetical protein O0S08_07720 [Nannocystis poenicansa]
MLNNDPHADLPNQSGPGDFPLAYVREIELARAAIEHLNKATEATDDAVRKLERAQVEANAVTKAFGARSEEAADATKRLKAAQEAAAQAADANAKATNDARKAVDAAAKATNNLSPELGKLRDGFEESSKAAERAAKSLLDVERGEDAVREKAKSVLGGAKDLAGMAVDVFKWAAEHNSEVGAGFERLQQSAVELGETLLEGAIARGMANIAHSLAEGAERLTEWFGGMRDYAAELGAYTKAHADALPWLTDVARQTMLTAEAQAILNEQLRVSRIIREEQAQKEGVLAGLAERDRREREARKRDYDGRQKSSDAAAAAAEEAAASRRGRGRSRAPAEDLTASPVSRDYVGPEEVSVEADVYEREVALREKRIEVMGRELEALEARGIAESEQIDFILYNVEIESETALAREALIDQRIAAEERLARWQIQNAQTFEQREKAQTRLEQIEHQKRLVGLKKTADVEEKEQEKRKKTMQVVSGAVTALGEGMADALERMAQGEKGAIASMLSELLKGVAKKHAILALGEAALAIGAAASYRYAAAAQHGTAAALHIGVAAAAAGGAIAAGAIAESRGAGGGGGGGSSGQSALNTAQSSGGSGGGGGGDEGLEAQDVPISHEQLRRGDASSGGTGGAKIVINNPHIYGAGGLKEFAATLRTEIERQDRGGRKPRL